MVNLLLSDLDFNNKAKVIIREAKNTWEVGKKIGFDIQGDERRVIEDITHLEER